MSEWQAVQFSHARQIAEAMDVDEDLWPDPAIEAQTGYAALREANDLSGAITYLAHALPRFAAAAWAAHLLDAESRLRDLARRDRLALDTALRWVGDPTDAHRRAAYEAAGAAGARSPERYVGFAIFYTSGSIAAPDAPFVAPPLAVTPRYAAGAITQAGFRTPDPDAFLLRALHAGEVAAARGAGALSELVL